MLSDNAIVVFADASQEAVHAAFMQVWNHAKAQIALRGHTWTDGDGEIHSRRWVIAFDEDIEGVSTKQRRFYWGVVLKQISEQAPGGWTPDAWHEAMKRVELGYEIKQVKVAGRKRTTTIRRLKSTTDLTSKQMSEYIERVIAAATQAYGVVFDFDQQEREAARHKAPARRARTEANALPQAG